ncbi:DUF1570 domain-containing protein [Blastopirellula sp. JC732]|uniref:DUF1570 domain-containing protein n=1 Tax=Blastopirellula sediminis TaxID=2894196 RepID=A0A9X1MUP1_9BACT|nr:DUF1570 domain-containing protein [Blastopirellula sediminis]MCC9604762.1 DUF1570 domain-containing protein [Blastopirellula sediminis]MCC9631939.1 DUF1570 domain-containing protein [Blastopirellula sediminis]
MNFARSLSPVLITLALSVSALAEDTLTFRYNDAEVTKTGRVIANAESGVILETPDNMMWPILADDLIASKQDATEFAPLDKKQLTEKLLAELPPGFEVHETAHYLICFNTSKAYAYWCGSLYERLYRGFVNYWKQRGVNLVEPTQPMVAVIFDNKQNYAAYGKEELGDAAGSIIGYYSMHTNRVAMYDLTGVDAARAQGSSQRDIARINSILARPEAAYLVATIVHEATHQIAYNCGLQVRLADNPVWVSEGLAIYFETPDLSSSRGWRGIGEVNRIRLPQAKRLVQRPGGQLIASLLVDDDQFRKAETALDAYALAWALNYYLLKRYPDAYANYLKHLSERRPLHDPPREERLAEFQRFITSDLDAFEADFRKVIAGLR